MNEIQVTVRGNVATEPRQVRFDDGNVLTSFRVASNARYFDRERQEWIVRGTTYLTVICRKSLAVNVAGCVRKGQPIVAAGRLRDRAWTTTEGERRTSVEIDADTLGHDLSYGTTDFVRVVRAERVRTAEEQAEDELADRVARDAQDGSAVDVSALHVLDDAPQPGGGEALEGRRTGEGSAAPLDQDEFDPELYGGFDAAGAEDGSASRRQPAVA